MIKLKKRHIIEIVLITIGLLYLFWSWGTINPNRVKISEDVYLQRKNKNYSIYCEINNSFKERTYGKLIAHSVDSIILTYKYGTIFHGIRPNKRKSEWFYIDASPNKNIYDGYHSIEEAVNSVIGEEYLDSVLTVEEVWNKFN